MGAEGLDVDLPVIYGDRSMKFELKQLRESTPEEYAKIITHTVNDLIEALYKERQKTSRLVAAIAKLTRKPK